MDNITVSHTALIACLLEMGELMLDCGAEISRVEDTLRRLGAAYGAQRTEVFVIPSIISISLDFPESEVLTETRRIRSRPSPPTGRTRRTSSSTASPAWPTATGRGRTAPTTPSAARRFASRSSTARLARSTN